MHVIIVCASSTVINNQPTKGKPQVQKIQVSRSHTKAHAWGDHCKLCGVQQINGLYDKIRSIRSAGDQQPVHYDSSSVSVTDKALNEPCVTDSISALVMA
jgi:hypothetical protein